MANFWGITAAFIALEIILGLGIFLTGRKGENGLKHLFAATTVVCAWSMWAIIYIAQLNPLIRPQLTVGE